MFFHAVVQNESTWFANLGKTHAIFLNVVEIRRFSTVHGAGQIISTNPFMRFANAFLFYFNFIYKHANSRKFRKKRTRSKCLILLHRMKSKNFVFKDFKGRKYVDANANCS